MQIVFVFYFIECTGCYKLVVLGDVHRNQVNLEQLVSQVSCQVEPTLGDLVDQYPSQEVVDASLRI